MRFKHENDRYEFDDGWHGIHNPGIAFFGGSQQPSGTTTQTTTTVPWSGQQPFLSQGFAGAQNLYQNYTPSYFGGNPVSPFSPAQLTALGGIEGQAFQGEPITNSAMNFGTGLQNGSYFANNPSNGFFANMASMNPVFSSSAISAFNPANPALSTYANGSMLGSNPYFGQTADSVMSQVVPQIESQFIGSNNGNNPAMAFAASQGAASAIAPYAFSNYNTEQQNQINAASQLGTNFNLGTELGLSGAGLQTNAAGGLSGNYNSAGQLGATSLALSPEIQAMPYFDYNQLMTAGGAEQTQNQNNINAAQQAWNYYQQLPYTVNNNFLGSVTGNYGNTSATTSPYFTNPVANALSAGLGVNSLLSGFGNPFSTQSSSQAIGQAATGGLFSSLFGGGDGGATASNMAAGLPFYMFAGG